MEVYRRGPKSNAKADYVTIVQNGAVTWYHADGRISSRNLATTSHGSVSPERWLRESKWKALRLPTHVIVVLRLSEPKNVYQFITSNLEEKMSIKNRGFAGMTDRNRQREIASKGGKAAHRLKVAHEWTSEEAREAGRKGGLASQKARASRSVSVNPLVSGEL